MVTEMAFIARTLGSSHGGSASSYRPKPSSTRQFRLPRANPVSTSWAPSAAPLPRPKDRHGYLSVARAGAGRTARGASECEGLLAVLLQWPGACVRWCVCVFVLQSRGERRAADSGLVRRRPPLVLLSRATWKLRLFVVVVRRRYRVSAGSETRRESDTHSDSCWFRSSSIVSTAVIVPNTHCHCHPAIIILEHPRAEPQAKVIVNSLAQFRAPRLG